MKVKAKGFIVARQSSLDRMGFTNTSNSQAVSRPAGSETSSSESPEEARLKRLKCSCDIASFHFSSTHVIPECQAAQRQAQVEHDLQAGCI